MEDNKNLEAEITETETPETKDEVETEKQPTMAELQAQMQKLMVENAKLKRSTDKATSEAADFKRKWKESLSEVEQANLDKAEKEAERETQFNEMKKALEISRAKDDYLAEGYTPDEAQKAALADVEGDKEEGRKIRSQVLSRLVKEETAKILKNRPDIHIGTGESKISKEQFDKMGMIEKSKLKNENPEEYERLKSL